MARSKKASPATVVEPVVNAPAGAPDPLAYTPVIVASVSDAEKEQRQLVADDVLAAYNKSIGARPLAESRGHAEQAPNLVGPAVDINAVLAKHLESTASNTGSTKVLISRSSVIRPVKLVHIIASEMYEKNPDVQRKEVIAACESMGIATHTARTQYQIWHQAMRSDLAVKAAQAAAPPKTVAQSLSRALDKNTAERKARK